MKQYLTLNLILSMAKEMLQLATVKEIPHCKFELSLVSFQEAREGVTLRIILSDSKHRQVHSKDFFLCTIDEYFEDPPELLFKWEKIAGEFILQFINTGLHCNLLQDIVVRTEFIEIKDVTKKTQSDVAMDLAFKEIKSGNYIF